MTATATYSPEDNKLRLTCSERLSTTEYETAKTAGFRWAPKQECFFATWSPAAEDLALSLAYEIEDEDKTLVERAEERADRFRDYSQSRLAEANALHAGADAIASHIPLGQPILVGHHSERRARRDAERIQNGMRKAVRAFDTAEYWKQRAAGAIRAAKYKERPDVRARRIKTLEAEERRMQRRKQDQIKAFAFWRGDMKFREKSTGNVRVASMTEENREFIVSLLGGLGCPEANVYLDGTSVWSLLDGQPVTLAEVQARVLPSLERSLMDTERWLAHYQNRLTYERAMLAEQGGTVADRTKPEKGGACRCWCSPSGGWSLIQKVNRVSVTLLDNWGNGGADFTRTIEFDKLKGVMSAAEVDEARRCGRVLGETRRGFFLAGRLPDEPKAAAPVVAPREDPAASLRAALAAGVQAVTVPQLFPTPPELAEQLVDAADTGPGHRILEPSAGTGRLLEALPPGVQVLAVEINPTLVDALRAKFAPQRIAEDFCVLAGDFLSLAPVESPAGLGTFDRVVMNPPFERGADLKHVQHAFSFLKPGGRLVAICAHRDATREWVKALGGWFIELPEGSFLSEGTAVRAAMVVLDR